MLLFYIKICVIDFCESLKIINVDKVKAKHVAVFIVSVVAIVFVYDWATTAYNKSKTTAPASIATPAAATT